MPLERPEDSFFFFLAPLLLLSLSFSSAFARRHFFSGDLLANLGDLSRPELSAVRQPPARQAGATGPRGSTLRSSPPHSPPVRSGSSSPFDLDWSSSSSSSSMASASGSWRGSLMHDDDIERLVRLRRIPREVVTRAPGEEVEPKPEPGERVVFGAHLDRGLGLPASAFFRRFLDFFGLQPHHLPANAAAEDLRLRPIYPSAGSFFPKIPTVDSVKAADDVLLCEERQPSLDRINLPEYNPAPPTTRLSWGQNAKSADPDAEIFPRQEIEDGDLAHKVWTADLVDPADQAGDQAGDDDLPAVPDRAAKGSTTRRLRRSSGRRRWSRPRPPRGRNRSGRCLCARGRLPPRRLPRRRRKPPASTARLEGQAKRQRQQGPKKVPEMAGAAIKFNQGGASGPAARVAPPFRRQREPTPPPTTRARTPPVVVVPPVVTPPPAGASSSAAPPSAPGQGAQGESAQRPTLGDLFPHRARCWGRAGAGQSVPPAAGAGAGGAAPPEEPEVVPTEPAAPPPASEPTRAEPAGKGPQREEPARARDVDSQALVRSKGPAVPPAGLHVAKGARLPGGAAWHGALYSGYRASLKNKVTEAMAQLATLEEADKMVDERRTVLYNKVVTSYQKAKIERGALAHELEAVKVEAAKVPQLERDLRVARAQCAESEEAGRAAAAKLKVADGELTRLRALEKNHLAELTSLRTAEKEKVEDLSRRLAEVEKQRLALQQEVTAKSTELTATAKHWTDLIGAIDVGFAGCRLGGRWRCEPEAGGGEGSSASFTMEDHMSSLAARVEPITKFGWELRKRLRSWCRSVAGKERRKTSQPYFLDRAGAGSLHRLEGVCHACWRRHGARPLLVQRGGLGQLEYRRAGVEEELSADQKAARLARASAIADFVDKRLFIADPNPHSDEEEELEDEGVEMDSPPPAVDPTGPAPAGV
ncbi:hypothetical protein QYE76_010662 [Lolium multiflorum]|uniref:Transposase (putative) gypsy type domain-containing protein n=1 Tax=Lolium multiflorum TaxID=4521 RepID=A0AAD8X3A9_LOLMU|nr:hypothetical protein QYE76_010662 [Lolium multiflorum]